MTTRGLLKDIRGVAAIEMAFALPVMVVLMISILQMGLVLHAAGGMRNALAEGIRFARVNPDASDTEVEDHAREALAGIDTDGITAVTFVRGTSGVASFGRLEMSYEVANVIPIVYLPPFELTQQKQTYLPY